MFWSSTLDLCLEKDLHRIAHKLKFIENDVAEFTHDEVYEITKIMNLLSVDEREECKSVFIYIAAILWEYAFQYRSCLKDIYIYLYSRIGYAPSSGVFDLSYKVTGLFSPLISMTAQLQAITRQVKNDVVVCNKRFSLTDYQLKLWKSIDTHRICGVSAPTSAGKSFLLVLKSSAKMIQAKCDIIYVVPTLSLVNQVTEDYISLLTKLEWNQFSVQQSGSENNNSQNPRIHILTQEKAIGLFSDNRRKISNNTFIIIDEIQNIERAFTDETDSRGRVLLDLIFELRDLENITNIIISGPRIKGIDLLGAKLFNDTESDNVSTHICPVANITYSVSKSNKKYYLNLHCSLSQHQHRLEIDNKDTIIGFGKKIYSEGFIDYLAKIVCRIGIENGSIIFSPTVPQARKTALRLSEVMPSYHNERLDLLAEYLRDTVRENYAMIEPIKKGIAYHHGKLPSHVRKVIELAAATGDIKVIACTTTLIQGINLPSQNVIIRNPHLYIKSKEGVQELSSYEMANLRGRAGRLLKDYIGRTYVLDENEFVTSDPNEYAAESPFEDKYKELDSDYQKSYSDKSEEINEFLGTPCITNSLHGMSKHLVIYIRQTLLRYGQTGDKNLVNVGIVLSDSLKRSILQQLSGLKVPKEICQKNRYWDPMLLDYMYNDSHIPDLPSFVLDPNAASKLYSLLTYLSKSEQYKYEYERKIKERNRQEKLLSIMCDTSVKWAREKKLSELLLSQYFSNSENVENFISIIQNDIAYDLCALLRPFYDVKGISDQFLSCVELGAFRPVTRKLIEMGIARETAVRIVEMCFGTHANDELDSHEIKKVILSTSFDYWTQKQLDILRYD